MKYKIQMIADTTEPIKLKIISNVTPLILFTQTTSIKK
jgi:hypothetical protein